MKNIHIEDKIKKLESLNNTDERLKLIYTWIKQDNISLNEFKTLFKRFYIEIGFADF